MKFMIYIIVKSGFIVKKYFCVKEIGAFFYLKEHKLPNTIKKNCILFHMFIFFINVVRTFDLSVTNWYLKLKGADERLKKRKVYKSIQEKWLE